MYQLTRLKSFSELFKEAWNKYSTHSKVLVPISLISGAGLFLQTLIVIFGTKVPASTSMYGHSGIANTATVLSPGYEWLSVLATVIYVIGLMWGTAALIHRINKLDQSITLKQSFLSVTGKIWPLFWTNILVGVITIIGFILFVVPGMLMAVWFAFTSYIIVVEHQSGIAAMKLSKQYIKGYWWAVFGRMFSMGLVVAAFSIVLSISLYFILGYATSVLVQDLIVLILLPFIVLFQFTLYQNLRSVKGVSDGDAVIVEQPVISSEEERV